MRSVLLSARVIGRGGRLGGVAAISLRSRIGEFIGPRDGSQRLLRRTCGRRLLDHCGPAVDHQLHAIDIARVVGGEEQRG